MKERDFFFDYVHLLYYKCHKKNPNHGGSYIDSPNWIKIKNVTINLINKKDNKCFQYAVTVALNYEEIGKNPDRIIKTKSLTNKYKWQGKSFPSQKDDWEKNEKNNVTIALNVLCAKKIYNLLMFQNIIEMVKNNLFF